MCLTNVYIDQFPDGKQLEFRQTTTCQYGQPGRPCDKHSTLENPVRNIQFGEPTTEYMITAHERVYPPTPQRSSSTDAVAGSTYGSSTKDRRRRRSGQKRVSPVQPIREHRKERIVILDSPMGSGVNPQAGPPPTPYLRPQNPFISSEEGEKQRWMRDESIADRVRRENDQRQNEQIQDGRKTWREAEIPLEERIRQAQQDDEIRGRLIAPKAKRPWAGFDMDQYDADEENHSRDRIVIVDAPSTPRPPPQLYKETFTTPAALASPYVIDGRERGRPIIVDERPLSFLARREAEEREYREAQRRRAEREARIAELEAERHREERTRQMDEEIRRRPAVPIPPAPLSQERVRQMDEEIRRRPAVPIPPAPLRQRSYFQPVMAQSQVLHGTMGGLSLNMRVREAARIAEATRRRRDERDRAIGSRMKEDEEEAIRQRLRERQMPKRTFEVGGGNRKHRVLYEDGVDRWEDDTYDRQLNEDLDGDRKVHAMPRSARPRPNLQQQPTLGPFQSPPLPGFEERSPPLSSTLHQHARKFVFGSREPSPNATSNHSHLSAYSESDITLPTIRPKLSVLTDGNLQAATTNKNDISRSSSERYRDLDDPFKEHRGDESTTSFIDSPNDIAGTESSKRKGPLSPAHPDPAQPDPAPQEGDSLRTNDDPRVFHDRDRVHDVMSLRNAFDQAADFPFRTDDSKETVEESTSLFGSPSDVVVNLPKWEPIGRSRKHGGISRSTSIESLQSLVDSIFSIASLSSASTVPITENAFQRVLVILKSDAILRVLYEEVTAKTSAEKFNRNFGTLLKRFGVDLEKEATCWDEQRAAQFIRSRARKIAQRIADVVYPTEPGSGKAMSAELTLIDQDRGESSEESDIEEEPDGFLELEKFITNSNAFQILRENVRGFLGLGLEPGLKGVVLDLGPSQLLAELPFAEEDQVDMSDETVYYEQSTSYRQRTWPSINFTQKLQNLLLPEPPIPDGMARVRWKCACGEQLYDDYQELKPGAAKRFEDLLRKSSCKSRVENSKGIAERLSNIGIGLKSVTAALGRSISFLKKSEKPRLVNIELRYYSDGRTTRTPAHTSGEVFYLLLCHNDGAGAEIVKLRQPDICDINNDQKLFNFLHEEYKALRKRWWTWISLWTLQSIKFVRFELYENELVDVKKLDEVPPPTKDNEYRHGPPNPPELNPPLGSTLLMHLFKHPTLAGTRKHCLKKIPRKLQNRLTVLNEDDAIGWGLQFIEGWSKKMLMYMTALTFGLSSLVVMILVAILGHDIQNAAAIASFMLSFVTIGIATAQAALHMS